MPYVTGNTPSHLHPPEFSSIFLSIPSSRCRGLNSSIALSTYCYLTMTSQKASGISLLNDDCLDYIFTQLAYLPFSQPPAFEPESRLPKLINVTVQTHQNLSLLACMLVCRTWNRVARRALHHTILLRTCDTDEWLERIPINLCRQDCDLDSSSDSSDTASIMSGSRSSLTSGESGEDEDGVGYHGIGWSRRRRWVRRLVIVGGGNRMLMGVPITPLWTLFPNVQELTIFGLGHLIGGLIAPESLLTLVKRGCPIFTNLTRLEVVGMGEYHPPETEMKKTMEDLARFLLLLPNLKSLSIQGMNYIHFCLPDWMESSSPSFQLESLEIDKCVLSLDSFLWVAKGSQDTLEHLSTKGSTIWQKADQENTKNQPALSLSARFATLVLATAWAAS
ncbi:hypothetical protein FRC18_011274 [Serendipita sp. 400]|nr:hypothetical protein FRC18_011274 [Serendipita sp. 400]